MDRSFSEEGAEMAAYSKNDNVKDDSPDCRRSARGLGFRSRLPRPDWRCFLVTLLMAGEMTLAAEPFEIEDISVPVASHGSAFESPDGNYNSVLVDDGSGQEIATTPAHPQEDLSVQGYDATFDRVYSCVIEPGMTDSVTAAPESMAWDSIAASSTAGGCGPGMLYGRHGEHGCRDHCGEFCDPDGPCHEGCPPGSRWAIQAEALVLWRNNIDDQPLLTGSDGEIALDAGDVRTAAAGGPRIGVLHNLGCGRAIEGNYFNVGGIQGSTETNGIGSPYTLSGLSVPPFTDIQSAEYTTRGQIKSAEINYRWCQGRRLIWLTGFRWVEWNEVATLDMQNFSDEEGPNNIESNVGNDLYGGQFGCRLKLWDLGKWQVGAVGKAGVFGNTAFQQTVAVVDGDASGPLRAGDTNVAFFGEVGVNSTLWLNRWLAWRAGYNFFWLEGVATAASQLPLANFESETASINSNESVFLQGFSTGLEARW
jgi:hypothetical protein